MRVLIDGTPLLVPGGGVKTHTFTWIRALLEQPQTSVEFRVFPFLRELPELNHVRMPGEAIDEQLRTAFAHFVGLKGNPTLGLLCRGTDVFHASHQIRALPRRATVTATVYDMTCWLLPEMHTRPNVEATKWYADHILRASEGLIAISECTRRDCAEVLGIPEQRIAVVYPNVREVFYEAGAEEAARARQKFNLHRPYVLFLGCLEPRKNLPRLLEAWRLLAARLPREAELAIAGPTGWEDPGFLATLKGTPGVRRLGYIPVPDLPGVVKGADALVYPSLYEGFGLPPAEAMAAGGDRGGSRGRAHRQRLA